MIGLAASIPLFLFGADLALAQLAACAAVDTPGARIGDPRNDEVVNRGSYTAIEPWYVPVTLHVVRSSGGSGGISTADLDNAFMNSNHALAEVGGDMRVFRFGGVDYIDNDFGSMSPG